MDNFFKTQLDIYYQHPQLTAYVVFLDSKEAFTLYNGEHDDLVGEGHIHQYIAQLDTTLERLDERGLSLHKVIYSYKFGFKGDNQRFLDEVERMCNEYRKLLLGFLRSPARAGQHVLNGARFAAAALCCLQHVSVSQTTRYIKFLCAATYISHSFMLVCRGKFSWPPQESRQLALIHIRLLLPKSSKLEGLINLAKNYTFVRECTENLAYDTRLAKEAIATYLARNT